MGKWIDGQTLLTDTQTQRQSGVKIDSQCTEKQPDVQTYRLMNQKTEGHNWTNGHT